VGGKSTGLGVTGTPGRALRHRSSPRQRPTFTRTARRGAPRRPRRLLQGQRPANPGAGSRCSPLRLVSVLLSTARLQWTISRRKAWRSRGS